MAKQKDGRPKSLPLFVMVDPLPWHKLVEGEDVNPRFPVNYDGTLYFNPRLGYSQDIRDYQ